jgi:hypothetical protein
MIIDFEGTAVGNVKGKIVVNRHPISEIRTGYNSGKARVVVDFGHNPVPQFEIVREDDLLVVAFGKFQDLWGKKSQAETVSVNYGAGSSAEPVGAFERRGTDKNSEPSSNSMGRAELRNSVLVLEVADPQDQKKSYRFSIDRESRSLRIHEAPRRDSGLKSNLIMPLSQSPAASLEKERPVTAVMESQKSPLPSMSQVEFSRASSAQAGGEEFRTPVGRGWPLRIQEFTLKDRTNK